MAKILKVIKEPKRLYIRLLKKFSKFLNDEFYLKVLYQLRMNRKLNLSNPRTFNEKLQWLKLNYKPPILTIMADKYEAKVYVQSIIGDKYIIPTIGIWDKFEDINFKELPNSFVLKTTHDQGGVVICKDLSTFDINKANVKLNKHLKSNLFDISREWPYKNIHPRIIAEKFMEDRKSGGLKDYKFFCFNGEPKLLYVASGRQDKQNGLTFDYFDMDFNKLDITQAYEHSKNPIAKPEMFDEMVYISKKLSEGLPHVRVDLYEISGKIYFGELTFFHHGGFVPFKPEYWDDKLGSYLTLPK